MLANLQTPPSSSMRPNHNAFIPPVCSQQLSSTSYGAHLGQAMGAQGNALRKSLSKAHMFLFDFPRIKCLFCHLVGGHMLQRISSLPGYGSTGESTAGSSSADSGSESPNGSFSPGLDLDDNGELCMSQFCFCRLVIALGAATAPGLLCCANDSSINLPY